MAKELPPDGQSDYHANNSDIIISETHDEDDTDIIIHRKNNCSNKLEIIAQNNNNNNKSRVFADLKIQDLQDSSWNEQQIIVEQDNRSLILDNRSNSDSEPIAGNSKHTEKVEQNRTTTNHSVNNSAETTDNSIFLQEWIFDRQSSQELLKSIKTNVVTEVANKIHENTLAELSKLEKEEILDNEMFKSLSLQPKKQSKRDRDDNEKTGGLLKYAPKKKKQQVVPEVQNNNLSGRQSIQVDNALLQIETCNNEEIDRIEQIKVKQSPQIESNSGILKVTIEPTEEPIDTANLETPIVTPRKCTERQQTPPPIKSSRPNSKIRFKTAATVVKVSRRISKTTTRSKSTSNLSNVITKQPSSEVFQKSVTSINKTAILPALVQNHDENFGYEKQDSFTQTATAAQVPHTRKIDQSQNYQKGMPKPRRKFKTKTKIQPASCWHWDTNHVWYGCNGKGTGWRCVCGPLIFIIGPLVHFWRAFNLDLRVSNCWHDCWFYDRSFEWFECNGKGRGWIALLVPLYILLFPILAIMTLFTVICLAFCGGGAERKLERRQSDDEHSV